MDTSSVEPEPVESTPVTPEAPQPVPSIVMQPAAERPSPAAKPAGGLWLRVLQFVATIAVLLFLALGSHVGDAFEGFVTRVRNYLPRTRLAGLLSPAPQADEQSPSSPGAERVSQPAARPSASVRAAPVRAAPVPAAQVPATSRPTAAAPATPASVPATPGRPATTVAVVKAKPTSTAPRAAATREAQKATATPRRATPQAATTAAPVDDRPVPEAVSALIRQKYFEKLMAEGRQLYASGWFGPAMGRFRQAAGVNPRSANAHLWTARSAIRIGRYDVARTALERTITIAPSSDAAREARQLLEQVRDRG